MLLVDVLVQQGTVSPKDMDKALQHQKENGVPLDQALLSLGLVAPEQLQAARDYHPHPPKSIAETGLEASFLLNLTLKCMYVYGHETSAAIAKELRLARIIIRTLLEEGRHKALVEALGYDRANPTEMRYGLTGKGRDWATEALNQSQYVGPAPVPLAAYWDQVSKQRISNDRIGSDALGGSFSHLVLPDELVGRLGPAVNSGRSILFYGPPGNGKTSIAYAIAEAFRQTICVPHCIEVDGQVIKMFDSAVHPEVDSPEAAAVSESASADEESPEAAAVSESASADEETESARAEELDPRWLRCRRPVVITGGELTLEMLDLMFNPYARYYEAPLQLRATGGIFIVDDFGRQIVSPIAVLNRWIIPLDRRVDFLTLHTGKKFQVPFDELVIFSTNLSPKKLMDEGTLRRIYYKINIDAPTRADYEHIFERECAAHDVELPADLLPFLFSEFYDKGIVPLGRFHPGFIVEQVLTRCEYEGRPLKLDRVHVSDVLRNLYVTE